MCGIVIEHRDGQVLSVKPDRDDVLSRGHICPKAVALKDLHEDPDRLRRPMRRTSSGWEEISWAAAFDEIERRIGEVRARHGSDSVALYVGNPTVHNLGAMLSVGDFIAQMKKIDKLKGENVSEAAAIEFMREAVIAAFPTLTPEDANGMKLSQLRVLVEFIKDDAEGAEAEGKPPQE